jgi:hypothetical protein
MFVKTATPSLSLDALGPASVGMPVIDTNTLRQAALQNSWQRDQRVARRRLAVRWVLWWLWKYRYYLLAVSALCTVLAYLFYRFDHAGQPAAAVDSKPGGTTSTPPSDVRLRMQPQLLEPARRAPNSRAAPEEIQTPFQLKPTTQLTIKETNP